jgi:hypothetical protein
MLDIDRHKDMLKRELAKCADNRAQARVWMITADQDTARWAREAIAAGIPRYEVADLAGISRPTLNAILRRSG